MAPTLRALTLALVAISGINALPSSGDSLDSLDGDWKAGVMRRDIQAGRVNPAPAGFEQYTSPLVIPSPNSTGLGGWEASRVRAVSFVNSLTLDELVNMTTGAGIFGNCVGETGQIPRLNFSGICLNDSPVGVRFADFVSVFPAGINAAATFDENLIYRRGVAMGEEFRGKGVNVALVPMMNLARAPAAGRNWEGSGGDPFLSGIASAAMINGIQSTGVQACAKHYIANEQEIFRGGSGGTASSSNIDDRTMHEIYLWPFAKSVQAKVASIMCSYQRVNQTYACENSKLMNGILKQELGFQGFVVSDWAAAASGVNSALAGMDLNMPGFIAYGNVSEPDPSKSMNSYWGRNLSISVNNGSVPISRVRDMAVRIMTPYYYLKQDEAAFPKVNFNQLTEDTFVNGTQLNFHVNVQKDHYRLIREIGAASTILLKNPNGTLPFNAANVQRWGIFGSDAGPPPNGPNGCVDRGCNSGGTLAASWGSGTANFPYLIDPASAISNYIRENKRDAVVETVLDDYAYQQITKSARQSDKCIVFANSNSGEGYITVDRNMGDRNNLTLWNAGDALIASVTSQCRDTTVVLHTTGAVDMESFYNNPNVTAIVFAGLPGQESGNSLVDVLFGRVNPSGRLPYTIAKRRNDYGAEVLYISNSRGAIDVPQITYDDKLLIDHRWFDAQNITPRYEFGFGLSYTNFAYSNLTITQLGSTTQTPRQPVSAVNPPGGPAAIYEEVMRVNYSVRNSGGRDGHEVSQLYLGFPPAAGEPPKVLRGFKRTFITTGNSSTISITLARKDMSIWDVVTQAWVVPSGLFTVYIGSSSRNIRLTGTFTK